jgi:O-antigen/teichoic acid export membrane protein
MFYLALASRALGLEKFGVFTLVMTYGQLITNLVQFQSVKGVIRYGAHHTAAKPARLARLIGAMAVFDGFGILVGSLVAVVGIPLASRLFDWTRDLQVMAVIFSIAMLAASSGTPGGVLRLRNRFDTLAAIEVMGPILRLGGALLASIAGGGVAAFLAVWAFAAMAQNLAQWLAVRSLSDTRISLGSRPFRRAIGENERVWRFMMMTNFANSLTLFWVQLGTLAVGAVAGPAEAGGFRIAQRMAKAIGNPIELVTRAIYPEFAQSLARNAEAQVRTALKKMTLAATALGAIVVVLIALFGKLLLVLVGGEQFAFAYGLLVLFSISTALDLGAFALDPYLIAKGRAGLIMRVRLVGAVVYLAALGATLQPLGTTGAALAAICASAIMFLQLGVAAGRAGAPPLTH